MHAPREHLDEVERLVRLHDLSQRLFLRGQIRSQPVLQKARRDLCCKPAIMPLSTNFRSHAGEAARTALAAVLAGVLHICARHEYSYLLAVWSILCSSGSLGATVRMSVHAVGGAAFTVPISLFALSAGGAAAAMVPAAAAAATTHRLVALAVLVLCNGLVMCAADLPGIARKSLLALGAAGLLTVLAEPPIPDARAAVLPLLGIPDAAARGAGCAIVAALLPWPRTAVHRANEGLRATARGLTLLFDARLSALARPAGSSTESAAELAPSPLQLARVEAAVTRELGALPDVISAASWEAGACARARVSWHESQLAALLSLRGALSTLEDALHHTLTSLEPSSSALLLLRMLQPTLDGLASAAKEYALHVAGSHERPTDGRVGGQCVAALAAFDEAFMRARLQFIFTEAEADADAGSDGVAHVSGPNPHDGGAADASGRDGPGSGTDDAIDDGAGRGAAVDVRWTGHVRDFVAAEAALFAATRFVTTLHQACTLQAEGGGASGGASGADTSTRAVGPHPAAGPQGAVEAMATLCSATLSCVGRGTCTCASAHLSWARLSWRTIRTVPQRALACARSRSKDAARASVALLAACLIATHFDKGFWAAVTVGMILEPGLGASFRNGASRLQGSVVGAVFGVLIVSTSMQLGALRDALLLLALGVWTFTCTLVRVASAAHSYAGFVAAFTAIIMFLGPSCGLGARPETCDQHSDVSSWALARIEFTLAGVVLTLAASALIFPVDASFQSHSKMVDALDGLRLFFHHTVAEWIAKSTAASPHHPLPHGARRPSPAAASACAAAAAFDRWRDCRKDCGHRSCACSTERGA